jgi:peptide/nickel transport system substrate-binding protein
MSRIARPSVRMVALAVAGLTALAACSSSGSSTKAGGNTTPSTSLGGAFGTIPAAATGAQHAGTITWAEPPGTSPTWILPLVTSAAFSVNDTIDFSSELWRPLYWFQNGVAPSETPSMSLANDPVWSNGDTTATITLKSNYKWSDGQPITSRDVLFFFDEVKAAINEDPANWGPYSPGLGIPDEVASVTAPNASTVVFTMKKAVNPGWFLDDELSGVNPMPAHAWAKASANGPLLDYTIPANAKKIYNFLAAASGQLNTYATNPLWKVVDGPYTLTAFDASSGAFTLTPNQSYGGPHAKAESVFEAVPFTSDEAEFNAVRSGSIDIGYMPLDDAKLAPAVKAGGYNVFGYPGFFFNYVAYNFDDKSGDFNNIIAQLYIRQALAHLEDEPGYISAFMSEAGGQAYGPVPKYPASPYTPSDATTDPYPFSVPDAITLLKDHGWTVNTTGTDVCASAGTGPGECGAGIPAGTKLAFNLIYSNSPEYIGQECTALASEAASAGITIQLKSSNYNYIITYYDNPTSTGVPYVNKWATEDFGGFSMSTYPTSQGIFNGPGSENEGSYNDPTANALINDSVTSGNPSAVKTEASFLTMNQPGLFQPDADWVSVWKTNLSAPQAVWAATTQYYVDAEYMYFSG